MRIYTKTGDAGETSLYGGTRVSKAHQRLEAYGTVDELQAALGVAHAMLQGLGGVVKMITADVPAIQQDCFVICAELARTETKAERHDPLLANTRITWLEKRIDALDLQLPSLRHFIMQGGAPAGAELHLARAVARRAERAVIRLHHQDPVRPELITYLNRLSDYLFVAARWVNNTLGEKELPLQD